MLLRGEGGTAVLFERALNGGHRGGKDFFPAGNDDNRNGRFGGFTTVTSSYFGELNEDSRLN